jgi:hypothetical protein
MDAAVRCYAHPVAEEISRPVGGEADIVEKMAKGIGEYMIAAPNPDPWPGTAVASAVEPAPRTRRRPFVYLTASR